MSVTWERRYSLVSHLGGVRAVCVDTQASALVSCGEDALVKCWDLKSIWDESAHHDPPEPFANLRGHTSAVLCMALGEDGLLFSAGVDRKIRAWRLPDSRTHSVYGANLADQLRVLNVGSLVGHGDAVWAMAVHPHVPYLASASADGLVGVWSVHAEHLAHQAVGMETAFAMPRVASGGREERPTSVAWLPWGTAQLLAGLGSGGAASFDVNRAAAVAALPPPVSRGATSASVTSVACHPVQKLVAMAHADSSARILDASSGALVLQLPGHEDAVTAISWDALHGHTVVTGSHDGCLRFFDVRTGRCLQQLPVHRPLHDEAVQGLCCERRFVATAGADGSVALLAAADWAK